MAQTTLPLVPMISVTTTFNNVLATGTPDLLLAIPCAIGPTLCYRQGYFDTGTGGKVCLVPSAANALNVTVDCRPVGAGLWPNGFMGFNSRAGEPPCYIYSCGVVSVEKRSWGSIKGLYQ